MKTIVTLLVIFVLTSGFCQFSETELNTPVLDQPYEKLTRMVLTNFGEQRNMLINDKTMDRSAKTKYLIALLNQVVRARDLTYNWETRETIFYANVAPPAGPSAHQWNRPFSPH